MISARPLREVFDELASGDPARHDPAGLLREGGHADLPDDLVSEAIVSYADTAAVEVAEHLAPFVTTHSAVPIDGPADAGPDPARGIDLVATAPSADQLPADLDAGEAEPAASQVAVDGHAPEIPFGAGGDNHDHDLDVGFGAGDTAPAEMPSTAGDLDPAGDLDSAGDLDVDLAAQVPVDLEEAGVAGAGADVTADDEIGDPDRGLAESFGGGADEPDGPPAGGEVAGA